MPLKIGLQVYSIRNAMQTDYVQAIFDVVKIGYKHLELANLNAKTDFGCGFDVPVPKLKEIAAETGCHFFSAHIDPLTEKNVNQVLEYHAALGTKYLMSKPFSSTREGALRDCESYNRIGELCEKFGIQHCLHTGLAPYLDDGSWILDVLFNNTDPRYLKFEVDTYWMLRSGFDPIKVIQKFADRVIAVHQKDLPKNFAKEIDINKSLGRGNQLMHHNFFDFVGKEDFCEIGIGQMDIQGIINAANAFTDAEYIILEQDYTAYNEIESVNISFSNFQKYDGIEC
jgi:sugar phosphate isomerase/epimerase